MARRVKILALLMLAAALPATAKTFGLSLGATSPACLSIGSASYRLTTDRADVTVRLDPAAATPDIRIAFAEQAEEADFVFIDDGAAPACARGAGRRVKIDEAASELVVGLAAADARADYRIYVRSRWLEPQMAAALFAAAHAPPPRLSGRVAVRSN